MTERTEVGSGNPMEGEYGYCRAVRIGASVWVSGTAPVWPSGEVDPDVAVQARRCLSIISAALEEVGASLSDVVRTRLYLVDAADIDAVGPVHGEVFDAAGVRPACTGVVVSALLDPRWKVEIEADAVI